MQNVEKTIKLRLYTADATRKHLAQNISCEDFMNKFGGIDDQSIGALVGLIEHDQLQLKQPIEKLND